MTTVNIISQFLWVKNLGAAWLGHSGLGVTSLLKTWLQLRALPKRLAHRPGRLVLAVPFLVGLRQSVLSLGRGDWLSPAQRFERKNTKWKLSHTPPLLGCPMADGVPRLGIRSEPQLGPTTKELWQPQALNPLCQAGDWTCGLALRRDCRSCCATAGSLKHHFYDTASKVSGCLILPWSVRRESLKSAQLGELSFLKRMSKNLWTFFLFQLCPQNVRVMGPGTESKPELRPAPQLQPCRILNPLCRAGDWTASPTQWQAASLTHCATAGTPKLLDIFSFFLSF